MNMWNLFVFLFIIVFLSNSDNMSQESKSKSKEVKAEWIMSELISNPAEGIRIKGNPETVEYKTKKAVAFNGSADAIFLDEMPLAGLTQFTVEAIIYPGSGGNFEQRFLHIGEVTGDRLLLELRSTPAGWYFDAFISVGDQQKALIEPTILHPHDQWYHVAYVIDNGKLESFVNGKKELEWQLKIGPVQTGKTSIGVRQNEISWFKGAIYKIQVTSKVLKPEDFISF